MFAIYFSEVRLNYGIRGEYFWFDKSIEGSGATTLAQLMGITQSDDNVDYLYTFNINYTFLKQDNIAIEYKKSNEDSAYLINLTLAF